MANEYKIIEAEGYDRLENAVNNLLEEGWHPVGGITSPAKTSHRSRHRRVAQALIRYDEDVTEPEPADEGTPDEEDEPETEEIDESDDS